MRPNIARSSTYAVGMAECEKVSHHLEVQARITNLMGNESISRMESLKDDLDELNAACKKFCEHLETNGRIVALMQGEEKKHNANLVNDIRALQAACKGQCAHNLDFFEHINLASSHLYKFIEEARRAYSNSESFDSGTIRSTDCFSDLMTSIFGYDYTGDPIPEDKRFRILLCTAEEEQLFYTWWRRRNKAQQHIFKNIDRGELYEKAEDVKVTTITPGWNSQPIVMYREGEYREFNSIAECVKMTGYSRKKIDKAVKDNAAYLGWTWATREKWEEQNNDR